MGLALGAIALSSGVSRADDEAKPGLENFTFTVKKTADGPKCTHLGRPPTKDERVDIRVIVKDDLDLQPELVRQDGKRAELKIDKGYFKIEPDLAREARMVTVRFRGSDGEVICDWVRIVPAGQELAEARPVGPKGAAGDWAASVWFLGDAGEAAAEDLRKRLKGLGAVTRRTVFLYHLPSGQPMAPFPSGVTEGRDVQIVMIVRSGDERVIRLDTEDCQPVSHFRTEIRDLGSKQRALGSPGPEEDSDFILAPVGRLIRCGAGDMRYTLGSQPGSQDKPTATPGGGPAAPQPAVPETRAAFRLAVAGDGAPEAANESAGPDAEPPTSTGPAPGEVRATTSLRFRPKYHLGAIAMVGWDTARRDSFDARTVSGDTMPTIVRHDDRAGAEVYVGAVWMVNGVDYEDMRWYNHVANVFVAAEPTSPLTDFAAGLAITPTGGISIGLGMSFHKGTELDGPSVGDSFTGEGDVPTRSSWSKGDFGFIAGVTLDSKIYEAFVAQYKR